MTLSWNEIKDRALRFSKEWADTSKEEADAKPFLVEFFNVFGITSSTSQGVNTIPSLTLFISRLCNANQVWNEINLLFRSHRESEPRFLFIRRKI